MLAAIFHFMSIVIIELVPRSDIAREQTGTTPSKMSARLTCIHQLGEVPMHGYLYTELDPISVTVAEATELLGFKDPKTTYKLIHSGLIKARKIGRIYLVSYASLKKLIEG